MPGMTDLNILLVTSNKPPKPIDQIQLCKKALQEAVHFLAFLSFHLMLEVFDLAKHSGDSLNLLALRALKSRPLDDQL